MPEVAIIGAGVSGLCLALALNQRSIKCTVYESREASFKTVGGLMLAPNALRILDHLGLWESLQTKGYCFDTVEMRSDKDDLIDCWLMGSKERYGYPALRIVRPVLLDTLREAAAKRGVIIKYGQKYSHVVEESADDVIFELADGSKIKTEVLVGTDGIHSRVRRYIAPDVEPSYGGQCGIMALTEHNFRSTTESSNLPQTTIFYSKHGAMLALPQEADGSHTGLATQRSYPQQDRAGWERLMADKNMLHDFFTSNSKDWPTSIQEALQHLKPESLTIWPFHSLPKLPSWTSAQQHRIIIIGDAAHAIPPTGGQGACQAIEDAWTLAEVLESLLSSPKIVDSAMFSETIQTWQEAREHRVSQAKEMTTQLGNLRLPQAEREKLSKGSFSPLGDLTWLYESAPVNS